MVYRFTNSQGITYYLHGRKSVSGNGKERQLYFFSKEIKEGGLNAVPAGYEVAELKSGLPILKKKS